MRLDQTEAKVAFDDPVNAAWIDPKTETPYFVTFHCEVLASRKAFQMDGMSPFVASVHYFQDYQVFRQHELLRLKTRGLWSAIDRAVVHFEREQWDLLAPEILAVLDEELEASYLGRVRQMFECFEYSVQWFTFDRRDIWKAAGEQFADARRNHATALSSLADTYRSSGRLLSLWRQITGLHDELIAKYPTWMPILQLRYWRERPSSLGDLVVSDKRFDDLKPLYLAAFELFARLSVIGLALELIRTSGTPDVPTNKGAMSIWDFEKLENANKGAHLGRHTSTQHFAAQLDTTLRNGIGHNSAHYDPVTDEVVCIKTKGAALQEWRISYTDFCASTIELASAAFFAEAYVQELLKTAGGLRP
ncbi:MAG TPA: hypothetical protein VGS57_17165 [Thermoanaerobaculia bacterium]|jgi:hypothetical protein|nr:hypothetical protein [Thermoanaerobaculia bacterium]